MIRGKTTRYKLRALRASVILKRGGCLAHMTSTLPGIAADPASRQAVQRLQRFKQRTGPFLMLADSMSTALRQARYISPALRRLARASWPGAVTLIIPAKPGLHAACYKKSSMAIRVDALEQTRHLAKSCGGLLLSSSLNRRSQNLCELDLQLQMRMHAFLSGRLMGRPGSGKSSKIMGVWRDRYVTVRG